VGRLSLLLQNIILHSLYKINDERTVNSVYHLLTGKQSIQTIQDAHLFHLERFFSLYKQLKMETFNNALFPLIENNHIKKHEGNHFILTKSGEQIVKRFKLEQYNWHGMNYRLIDQQFIQRLFLIIQVWTNRQANINRYIPIIDDIKTIHWVKSFYRSEANNVSTHLNKLYEELVSLFSQLPVIYPQLFMNQITTDKSIGLTNEQLVKKFNRPLTDIYLLQKNYVHFILKSVKYQPKLFPMLYRFTEDLYNQKQTNTITSSAMHTANLVNNNLTPEQIASKRQLKVTTIYDHIVEIALHDERFPMTKFITDAEQQEIYEAVRRLNSFKLKEIKQLVNENISYFQIRLALTKLNQL